MEMEFTPATIFGSHAEASPVVKSREAREYLLCPPMKLYAPPAYTCPRKARAVTSLFASGAQGVARPVAGLNPAIWLRTARPMFPKLPPAYTVDPSNASELTPPSAAGFQAVALPVASSIAAM